MNRYLGRLIVLEGLDGAGTTSQAEHLLAFFQKSQMPCHKTAQPSKRAIGQLIRQCLQGHVDAPAPLAMNFLFAADREDHLSSEILPKLEQGIHVICDRYVLSSLVYQQVAGVSRKDIISANQHAYRPDLTILLDVSAHTAAERRSHRLLAPELYEKDVFLEQAAKLYRKEAEALQAEGQSIAIIDGNQTMEEVTESIKQAIGPYFS